MSSSKCHAGRKSKEVIKQHVKNAIGKYKHIEGESTGKKESLVCPKCKAVFKSVKTFQNHMETQTRMCRYKEQVLACGKKDRYLEWIGNKYKVREFIASHVPSQVSEIVSPFFGSGAVEFQLLRSRPNLRVFASDLDAGLVTFWQQFIRSPEDLVKHLRKLVPKNSLVYEHDFELAKKALQGNSKTDMKAAGSFWIVNKLTFNGFMEGTSCSWQKAQAEKLHQHREKRFQHMLGFAPFEVHQLELKMSNCFDAIEASSTDAFLFLDPPYLSTVQYTANCEGAFGNSLHEKLRKVLACRIKWILCHEDIPDIRRLYAGLHAIEYFQHSAIAYGGKRRGASARPSEIRRSELLILSPWVAEQLSAKEGIKMIVIGHSEATPLKSSFSSRFDTCCRELDAWASSHDGALPKQNSSDIDERRLAHFVNQVQANFKRGALGANQITQMRQIRGMTDRFARWESKYSGTSSAQIGEGIA